MKSVGSFPGLAIWLVCLHPVVGPAVVPTACGKHRSGDAGLQTPVQSDAAPVAVLSTAVVELVSIVVAAVLPCNAMAAGNTSTSSPVARPTPVRMFVDVS